MGLKTTTVSRVREIPVEAYNSTYLSGVSQEFANFCRLINIVSYKNGEVRSSRSDIVHLVKNADITGLSNSTVWINSPDGLIKMNSRLEQIAKYPSHLLGWVAYQNHVFFKDKTIDLPTTITSITCRLILKAGGLEL